MLFYIYFSRDELEPASTSSTMNALNNDCNNAEWTGTIWKTELRGLCAYQEKKCMSFRSRHNHIYIYTLYYIWWEGVQPRPSWYNTPVYYTAVTNNADTNYSRPIHHVWWAPWKCNLLRMVMHAINVRIHLSAVMTMMNNGTVTIDMNMYRVSWFADDTRILLGIKDEEDTQRLQNNLHELYKWADTSNMKFNDNKFELLRYGKEQEIKSATTYKSYDDSNIDDKLSLV